MGASRRDDSASKSGVEDSSTVPEQRSRAQRAGGVMSWRHELAQWLANPLLVTVVAAFLGSLLIPHITRGWQNHQKALEIKTDLVGQMSESVSDAVATGRIIAADLNPPSPSAQQQEWNDGYRAWSSSSASVAARLRAYAGSQVGSDWRTFAATVTNFFLLSAYNDARSRRQQVDAIKGDGDLRRHVHFKPAGWAALQAPKSNGDFRLVYPELARGILQRQDELVQRVLDSHISGF
jgi:hypothetical protein